MSKSQFAVAWMKENPEASIYKCAKTLGMSYQVVANALKRSQKPRCPTCNRTYDKRYKAQP